MSLPNKIAVQLVSLALLAPCIRPVQGAAVVASDSTVRPAAGSGSRVGAAPAADAVILPTPTNALRAARSTGLLGEVGYAASRGGVPVMVIPAQEMEAEAFSRIVMDLSVMSRIIEKSIRDAPALYDDMMAREFDDMYGSEMFGQLDDTRLRILRSSKGRPRPMYVGGYGAIFSLEVDFPLVPPPEMPREDQTAEPTDQVWAQAQRELLDPQAASRRQRRAPQAEPYRQEVVEGLKNALTDALKHATNIRDLGAEAWLTILVQGPAPTVQGLPADSPYGAPLPPLVGPRSTAGTRLTLRARKADIDQYAEGQLDDAQFQQRVQTVTY
jgi:hypothetical protein